MITSALAIAALLLLSIVTPATAHTDHGPDLGIARILAPATGQAADVDDGVDAALAGQRYPWAFPRSTVDRPDEKVGRQIHVIYLVPAAAPDDHYDTLGVLEDSLRSMNHWMRQQTGNQQWSLDTYTFRPEGSSEPVNAIDVTFVASDKVQSQLGSVSAVQGELEARGFDDPNKRYLSYVAANAGGVCGDAWYPLDPSPTEVDGKYADVYLYSSEGCNPRDFATSPTEPSHVEATAMQELIHNDGMVPLVAPHDCLVSLLAFGHVCTGPLWASDVVGQGLDPERFDVMYPYVGVPLGEKKLDEDHLDYYRHLAPYRDLEQGLYLETV